jgi:hypothetical protein
VEFEALTKDLVEQCADTTRIVLEKAGAFPRDSVTLRTIDEVKARTGSFGAKAPADLMTGLTAGAARRTAACAATCRP